jgi:hypothetical protein
MIRNLVPCGGFVLLVLCTMPTVAIQRPAPPPSRYGYSFKIDEKSLPKGVTVRTVGEGKTARYFIKNASATPLVIGEIFSNDKLVSGTKLENGKVYGWFPSGVPMEGKTHLKGWQAPFGDIEETPFNMPREPAKIVEGRKPGLGKELPKPEESSIKVSYDGKPLEIKITIQYWLNDDYDKASKPD